MNMNNCPYPGLHFFDSEKWPFHGRDKDVSALLDLLLTNRIVVLHAQSGAGKTSLINRGLIPALQEMGHFQQLPVIRVNENLQTLKQAWDGENKVEAFDETQWNRFSWSLLRSLESGNGSSKKIPPIALAKLKIYDHLDKSPWINNDVPKLLIFDQFEELLTKQPQDIEAKEQFFRDLGIALRNKSFWAIFVVREEFVSALQPYYQYLPNAVVQSYRMELLDEQSARDAITKPALAQNITFEKAAVDKLVKTLKSYQRYDLTGKQQTYSGKWIAPLFLQIACCQLWRELNSGTTSINAADITIQAGDLNQAVGDYYATALDDIYPNNIQQQRWARNWIGTMLIDRLSNQKRHINVNEKITATRKIIKLVKALCDKNIIRQVRENTGIYELSHDRLIAPILENNIQWLETNIPWFERIIDTSVKNKDKDKTQYLSEVWQQLAKAMDWLIDKDPKGNAFQIKGTSGMIKHSRKHHV